MTGVGGAGWPPATADIKPPVDPPLAVADVPNWLAPAGPAAERIPTLWWVMLGIATVVFLVVTVLSVVAIRRRSGWGTRTRDGNLLVLVGGVVVPTVVLAGLAVATYVVGAGLITPDEDRVGVVIDITGHKFWFDVRYPDHDIRIANEVRIPVGEPVLLRLHSQDVIHTAWIPQLGAKRDMVPGEINEKWWEASEPGEYRGFCTEYCGIQHANMQLVAVAMPATEFAQWLEDRGQPPTPPMEGTAAQGRELFEGVGCAECHTIDGVSPRNEGYPDLTWLGERRTIGAGILRNNRGNLGGWILDPQTQKPGNHMPPANLDGPELQALLDYLETLQ